MTVSIHHYIIYSYDLPSRKCVVTFYIKVCKWSLKKIDFVGSELSIQDIFGCAYFVKHFPPLYILRWVYILIASSNIEHLKNQFCNLSSYSTSSAFNKQPFLFMQNTTDFSSGDLMHLLVWNGSFQYKIWLLIHSVSFVCKRYTFYYIDRTRSDSVVN